MTKTTCPNCGKSVAGHPRDDCVLGALIQCIRDRDTVSERRLRKLHKDCNTDELWLDLGRVIDKLEDGRYS